MKNAEHVEIETKYDIADDAVLPSFMGIEGVAAVEQPVEEHLDAEYFDTADHRLLRGRFTLRRRSGGADAGWHLKLPRAAGGRLEVRRPLGRSATRVPKALSDLATAHTRGRPLVPVARLRTARTIHRLLADDGRPLAEVADDHVLAETPGGEATSWREIEVELTDALSTGGTGGADDELGPALLDAVGARLRDAGAVPSTSASKLGRAIGAGPADGGDERPEPDAKSSAGEVVLAYLAEQVDKVVELDPAVRRDDPDAVHKMRVACRRLRSALATYRRLLDRSVTDPLRDELKWLGGVLGPVRDAEVIRDHLREALDEQPRALVIGPVRRRVDTSLRADHRRAHAAALVELTGDRYFRLLDALDAVAAGGVLAGPKVTKPAAKVLAKEIGRTHGRLSKAVQAAVDAAADAHGPPDDALHEVRKAAKRVRYAAESGAPVFGSRAEGLVTRMQDVQDVLGEHQDSVVVRHILVDMTGQAQGAGEPSFTYGRLHALEEGRAERSASNFQAMLDDGVADTPSWLR